MSKYRRYARYKDSGVEWIGEIPEEWEISKIKFTTYVKGRIGWQGLRADEFIDEGPYLVTGTDFIDGLVNWNTCYHISMERYNEAPSIQLKENDLLITKDGTIGKVAIVKNKPKYAILNSGIFVTRPQNSAYLTEFMYWILNSQIFNRFIEYMSIGSTIVHLYQQTFQNFSFPITDLNEQKAIANFLDQKTAEIDGLIADKGKLIELLQGKRQAIIGEAVTKGLNQNVRMKDSRIKWIGEIPEHWEVTKIKYAFYNLDYMRIPLSSEERGLMGNKVYDYYGASGVIDTVDDYIFDDTLILIGEDGANLYSRSTPLAYLATGKFWVNNHAHILKPKKGNINYFVNLLESIDYTIYISGSAQPKLTQERLGSISIPIPPGSEQNLIGDYLVVETLKIDTLITNISTQIQKLKEYRQSLISEAVTGKIDVRDYVVG
jgi:type I restriction enzyme S subunit